MIAINIGGTTQVQVVEKDFHLQVLSLSQDKRMRAQCNKLFVYGILKRGFALDLEREGCKFLGEATLQPANIYRIGEGVGLLIENEGKVYGEVFEIPNRLWHWLDRIEGHPYTYMRQIVQVRENPPLPFDDRGEMHDAWVYVHQHEEYLGELIESGRYLEGGRYARG
jgi:gamma-glutamylcyclotransferase (GGCT)/AIG2-like uncharacterized protein YtfP